MNSFSNALKSEIARVARKELKDEMLALRKAASSHRSEIAALKREVKTLASLVKLAQRAVKAAAPKVEEKAADVDQPRRIRFSAEAFAAQRAKLGISQAQMAELVGASALSVYKWESGKVQPRAAQLARIVAIRKLGKREAAARLRKA